MYCTGSEFRKKMQVYIEKIQQKSAGVLRFVEYIPLPHFGNTILRFDINRASYTLEDVDGYEVFVQDIVQDEFLVDFMGSVYQKVGLEPWTYEVRFRKCFHKYKDVPIAEGDDQRLKDDAVFLLKQCGLSVDAKVWEIQIDEEIAVFILGQKNREMGVYAVEDGKIHVCEVEEIPCLGLMKACIYAKQQKVSMVRVLLEAEI